MTLRRFIQPMGVLMKLILSLAMAAILSACATPYGKHGIVGGYTDSQIDENTFSIRVEANSFTSEETAKLHAMYRAAEITVQSGFDYFLIVGGGSGAKTGTIILPSTSTSVTTAQGYGQARTSTNYAPTVAIPMAYPNSSLTIKAYKGSKPESDPSAYDARSVMKYLGPKIGV